MVMDCKIEEKLEAALKYDVINGNRHEKTVLASQINEAIMEIRLLRKQVLALQEEE